MIRALLKTLKWLFVLSLLLIVGLASPIGYVELFCRAEPRANSHQPLVTDARWQRAEANTYLTYPEWHIVYAYDGMAETLKTGDEHAFPYVSSIASFWSSTCTLMKIADDHGGADTGTRVMIHTIGASFTLEMAAKAAYEETLGRLFTVIRGPDKTTQDSLARDMAVDYAGFLRQTPWYKYDFDAQAAKLWSLPLTKSPLRAWERRLALGAEWKAKALYAQAIAAGVAATGEASLSIRSIVAGLPAERLGAIENVRVVAELADGVLIETPRYAAFTKILATVAVAGGTFREIAGNDDVMVSVTVDPDSPFIGPGTVIARLPREGFSGNPARERRLISLKVAELAALIRLSPPGEPGLEHVFDY